jgi:hypothetical protein
VALAVEVLASSEGGRHACEQWVWVWGALEALIVRRQECEGEEELERLKTKQPYLLRRDIEASKARGAERAGA